MFFAAEHVFEGQLISDFFTFWLNEGRLNERDEIVYSTPKMRCAVTKAWVNKVDPAFQIIRNGVRGKAAFPQLLLSELGNQQHLDRLTIMLARVNQRKGRVSKFSPNFRCDYYLLSLSCDLISII